MFREKLINKIINYVPFMIWSIDIEIAGNKVQGTFENRSCDRFLVIASEDDVVYKKWEEVN